FGMPVLEALANNCPVCLSNTSSLPEVAGSAAEFFDPTSQDSILEGVKRVIYNKKYSEKLIEEGKIQLKKFSWKNCATKTAETYQRAIS
ncbi:MAG: glycosyltransferase, partial [Ginsengibacter sp.]